MIAIHVQMESECNHLKMQVNQVTGGTAIQQDICFEGCSESHCMSQAFRCNGLQMYEECRSATDTRYHGQFEPFSLQQADSEIMLVVHVGTVFCMGNIISSSSWSEA